MDKLPSSDELIFRVAIPVPVYRLFDYLAPDQVELDNIKPGVRLEVPFGKGKKIGFLLEIAQQQRTRYQQIETGCASSGSQAVIIHKGFAIVDLGQ